MFFHEILTTADDALLIPRLGLTEEVDGRDAALLGSRSYIGESLSSDVAVVEKEDGGEEEERHQGKRVSGVAPKEGHGVG